MNYIDVILQEIKKFNPFFIVYHFHRIFYPSNSPGNCVFGLVLTVQPQPGPDPCLSTGFRI